MASRCIVHVTQFQVSTDVCVADVWSCWNVSYHAMLTCIISSGAVMQVGGTPKYSSRVIECYGWHFSWGASVCFSACMACTICRDLFVSFSHPSAWRADMSSHIFCVIAIEVDAFYPTLITCTYVHVLLCLPLQLLLWDTYYRSWKRIKTSNNLFLEYHNRCCPVLETLLSVQCTDIKVDYFHDWPPGHSWIPTLCTFLLYEWVCFQIVSVLHLPEDLVMMLSGMRCWVVGHACPYTWSWINMLHTSTGTDTST